MRDLLFIYGTLHPDRAPAEIAAAARRLQPIGPQQFEAISITSANTPA